MVRGQGCYGNDRDGFQERLWHIRSVDVERHNHIQSNDDVDSEQVEIFVILWRLDRGVARRGLRGLKHPSWLWGGPRKMP